jgi:nicotinamidase-related amidase
MKIKTIHFGIIWLIILIVSVNPERVSGQVLVDMERTGQTFKLPIRYYQIAQLYGPGMPPSGEEGLHMDTLNINAGKIGLVLVHTWNLGEADGPYPIYDTTIWKDGEAGAWVPEAHKIIEYNIYPVLKAARQSGIKVFHLAQSTYAEKYPQYQAIKNDQELQNPVRRGAFEKSIDPVSYQEGWKREYGENYPGPVWKTHTKEFDIAHLLKPLPDESVFVTGWQLNGLCRRENISVLIYAGFMADLCLLNIPGAIREMTNTFHYKCVVLRDCTIAYEYEETLEGKWMTFAAIRMVESEFGYSATAEEFIKACLQQDE